MPGGLDLFSWSLPFLADKIAEMMDYVLMKNSLVSKKEIKESRKSSVVDFQKIIKELNDEKEKQDSERINKIKANSFLKNLF